MIERTVPGSPDAPQLQASAVSALSVDEAQDDFRPMTPLQAQQWRSRQPNMSLWRLVWWQVLIVVLATLATWLVAEQESVAWSVFYGGLSILLPTTIMVFGASLNLLGRMFPGMAQAGLLEFALWEMVKLLLALIMLWTAPWWVADLNWLALVAGVVLTLKGYWLAFMLQGFRARQP